MIKKEVDDLDTYWNDLLFNVTGGKANEMNELKKFNIIDFFDYIENKRNG